MVCMVMVSVSGLVNARPQSKGSRNVVDIPNVVPKAVCKSVYKLYVTVDIVELAKENYLTGDYTFFTSTCISKYKNLFCQNTTSNDWKERKCTQHGRKLNCQIYPNFANYQKFFRWQITTTAIKVVAKRRNEVHNTVMIAVTPFLSCDDILLIDSENFNAKVKNIEEPEVVVNPASTPTK